MRKLRLSLPCFCSFSSQLSFANLPRSCIVDWYVERRRRVNAINVKKANDDHGRPLSESEETEMFVKGLRKFLYAGALLALAPIVAINADEPKKALPLPNVPGTVTTVPAASTTTTTVPTSIPGTINGPVNGTF